MPQSLPETSDSACTIERKATLFLGTKKYETSWVKIVRGPRAQYVDAFHVEFKPKGARNLRAYVETFRPKTVIVEGWGHPEFDFLLRAFDEVPFVETSPGVSVKTVTVSYVSGKREKSKYELEFERYLESLDPSRILFDSRGAVINIRK